MMIWSGGFRDILMGKAGVRAEDTYLWADLLVRDPSAIRRREVLWVWTFVAGAAESRVEGDQQHCRFTVTRVVHDYSLLQMLWLQFRRRTGRSVALASSDWLTIRYMPLADACRAGRRRVARPRRTAGGGLIGKTRFQCVAAVAPSALIFNLWAEN